MVWQYAGWCIGLVCLPVYADLDSFAATAAVQRQSGLHHQLGLAGVQLTGRATSHLCQLNKAPPLALMFAGLLAIPQVLLQT